MKAREIRPGLSWLGAVDWHRRLFDSLIPLPDGTSYNAYLVQGSEKIALLDSVDPSQRDTLCAQLEGVPHVDYIIAHHGEQDHSGCLPEVLQRYPSATLLCSAKARSLLLDLLPLPEDRLRTVEDGETLDLGGRVLEFLYTPWVHWPETMVTYLREDRVLFSCDFFGSHLATTDLYAADEARVYEAAKRYYAEIMMPFAKVIRKNLEKLEGRPIDLIAPSHGPLYARPSFILDAYCEWTSGVPQNVVALPFVSMHGSTQALVDRLTAGLTAHGVTVHPFDLTVVDLGRLAAVLVDAATLVLGTPVVNGGLHPLAVSAACLANLLRPKARYAAVIGSYGWSRKPLEQAAGLLPDLKLELLGAVLCQGRPRPADLEALDHLAAQIAEKHRSLTAGTTAAGR